MSKQILIIVLDRDTWGNTKLSSRKVELYGGKGRPVKYKYVTKRRAGFEEALYIDSKTLNVELKQKDNLTGWQ